MNPTNDSHDDELRELLRAVCHDGERKAPAFAQTWRAANARRQPAVVPRRLAWAVATAATVTLLVLMAWPRQPKSVPVATFPAASDEALPTDFLLTTSNDDSVDRVAGEIDALLRP